MGRLYEGLWRVLVVYDNKHGAEEYAYTEPDTYDECQIRCMLHGMGVPFEGNRVKRALIVGPILL
jgi:hypothetical protein